MDEGSAVRREGSDVRKAKIAAKSAELRRSLEWHSVALHYVQQGETKPTWKGAGSGVLLRIKNRFFLLTAGHCVRDAAGRQTLATIQREQHKFSLAGRSNFEFVPNTNRDFGYFEIPANDAATVESLEKVFLSENRLQVVTTSVAQHIDGYLCIFGYPVAGMVHETDWKKWSQALCYVCIAAGMGTAPSSSLQGMLPGIQSFDIAVSIQGNERYAVNGEQPDKMEVPEFSGASGAGCWNLNVLKGDLDWRPQQATLVGIHSSSHSLGKKDDPNVRFAREVLIGHHLAMIASDYADLAEHMRLLWPNLEEFDQ